MASLKRIEALASRLNYAEPKWVRGYPDEKRDNHLSGALREASDNVWGDKTGVASEVLTPEELALMGLLSEAAETLDDAHEEWLNTTLAARDLVGDIAACKCSDPRDVEDKMCGSCNGSGKQDPEQKDICDAPCTTCDGSGMQEPAEHWFGGFHPSWDDDSAIEIQTYVEWPNLGITVDALTQVLQGKEYKL
jgi:hypothetical protein